MLIIIPTLQLLLCSGNPNFPQPLVEGDRPILYNYFVTDEDLECIHEAV